MGSTSTISADEEEFMDDLITLAPLASGDSDCEIVSYSENKSRPEVKKKPHSDAQNKPQTDSLYGKGDFYLPARFFDISRNTSLLQRCRAMSVCIVDCGKFPWYYRKKCGIRKPRPKSKQIYTLQNLLQDMRFQQKLKQQKLEKNVSEYRNKSKEVVCKVSLTPSKDPSSVDFKKNKGLVGLKIERKLVGLVFDEKSKEERKRKGKHTTDKSKNKSSEGKETKREKANYFSIEKNKASKVQDENSELMIDKVDKILVVKENSLKCSLNLNPLLSPSVQQKLLQMVSKSVQNTTSSSIDSVNLSSNNMYTSNNKCIIGQKVKHVNFNTTKVSTGDSVSDKIVVATPILKGLLDKNTLPSTKPAKTQKNVVVEPEIAKNSLPEKQDLKIESTPKEVIKPEQVHIKTEPEIKQELKDEALSNDRTLNEGRTTSVIHSNPQLASVCSPSNLRSFRRSIENIDTSVGIKDVGESIPVQTAVDSNQNIVNWQWHQYNEVGLHANPNYPHNNYPSYKLPIPQTQPNNLEVTAQNIVSDSTKSKVGDLKVQTVSQINNSVATQAVSALSKLLHSTPVANNVYNNELQFHPNNNSAQLAARGSETNYISPKNLFANNAQEKKIVKIKNASYKMNNQKRNVPVGPYTGPPYQQYGYQPCMRTSGPPVHTHLASKMPLITHQINQRQWPIPQHSYWDRPPSNQEYFYRPNQAYDEYYHSDQWNRPPLLPQPTYSVERQRKYVPPYARQKNRPPNYKPEERVISTPDLEINAIINQVTALPIVSSHTPPLQGPQTVQCVKEISRAINTPVPTLPTPSTVVTSLPQLSPQTVTLSVSQPVQEMQTAQILYPNTTFSEEFTNSQVIYTEGGNHINTATHKNQQTIERCLTQINTTEMPQTPIELPKNNQKEAVRALDMPIITDDVCNRPPLTNAANNVLLPQQQDKNSTPSPTATLKPIFLTKTHPNKRLFISSNDTKTAPCEGTVTTVSERSVPAVLERNVKKGYSPPILPIPTVQKSLEMLALVNSNKTPNHEPNNLNRNSVLTPVKQSGFRNNEVDGKPQITTKKVMPPMKFIENSTEKISEKRKLNQTPQSATKARKISIDEYKKRHDNPKSVDVTVDLSDHKNKELTPTKDNSHKMRFNTNNENRGVDLQDLGYDSDPPSKF